MLKLFNATIITCLCVWAAGCGSGEQAPYSSDDFQTSWEPASDAMASVAGSQQLDLSPELHSEASQNPSEMSESANDSSADASTATAKATDSVRKIVYTAQLNLSVASFEGVADSVIRLSHQFGGFVARANIAETSTDRRTGSWTLRIPTQQYRAFLAATGDLGTVSSLSESTKEVTAEFYDVDARIRNKQQEEERLNRILEERPGKLDDVLTVEREVSRVRQEIEVMQGRLRILRDLTSYSTISIAVQEIPHITPPTPTFGALVVRQWQSTMANLLAVFQHGVLWTIAIGPWLVVASVPTAVVVLLKRQFAAKPPESGPVA